jgi:hypothetical protein
MPYRPCRSRFSDNLFFEFQFSTIILYVLLKPVSHNAALLMLGFNVVQDAIGGLNVLNTVAIAGACYLIDSAAVLLSPRLASMLFPSIFAPAFIGELSFAMWLTVKGVNVARWQEKPGRSTASL